jgi:hypothetical protein
LGHQLQHRLQRQKVRFGEAKITSNVQWQAEKMALDGGGSESIQLDRDRRCAVQNVQRLIEIDGHEQVYVALKDVMSVDVDLEQQWRLALTHGRRGQRTWHGCCVQCALEKQLPPQTLHSIAKLSLSNIL